MTYPAPGIHSIACRLGAFAAVAMAALPAVVADSRDRPTRPALPAYSIRDLGQLGAPGTYQDSFATAINNAGQVVGLSSLGDVDEFSAHAFRWADGRMTDLGVFPGDMDSEAAAINNAGTVAGDSSPPYQENEPHGVRGVIWQSGRVQDLGAIRGVPDLYPTALNDSGSVVGYGYDRSTFRHTPFLWRNNQLQVLQLGILSDEIPWAINNAGQIVGGFAQAFLWKNGRTLRLPGLGGPWSSARDINEAGDIVGFVTTPTRTERAVLWHNGRTTFLGTLPGLPDGEALAVNSSLQVVGHAILFGHSDVLYERLRPFLWQQGRMVGLDQLLPRGHGWHLMEVADINDAGQIVGWGFNPDGDRRPFLMTPPSPTVRNRLEPAP
jgi:probable HAF family extracellular repeat protein